MDLVQILQELLQDISLELFYNNSTLAGLVELVATKEIDSVDGKQQLYSGRRITSSGQKLLDEAAHSCRDLANEMYPGLAKY